MYSTQLNQINDKIRFLPKGSYYQKELYAHNISIYACYDGEQRGRNSNWNICIKIMILQPRLNFGFTSGEYKHFHNVVEIEKCGAKKRQD